MIEPYDDIIRLPHHISAVRPQMPMADRAAQFSPFAALTGFDDAIGETGRLTDERIEMDEDARNILNMKLLVLIDHLNDRPEVTFTCFRPVNLSTAEPSMVPGFRSTEAAAPRSWLCCTS